MNTYQLKKSFSQSYFNHVLLLVVMILLSINSSTAQGKHLFILSGQSNMANFNATTSFKPHVDREFGVGNSIIVKEAMGTQPIYQWYKQWKSPTGEIPNPDTRGEIYDRLMAKVYPAIKNIEIATITFVWVQGERDAGQNYGPVYEASLIGVINQLKTDLKRNDINVVLGRLNDFGFGRADYRDWTLVRNIQTNFKKIYPNSTWVHTDDLNDGLSNGVQFVNDIHMTITGYTVFGIRVANAAINLIRSGEISDSEVRDVDGNIYKTIKIGKHIWMKDNLKTTKFTNGEAITMVPTVANTQWGATNTSAYSIFRGGEDNFWKYGLLYNHYTLEDYRGICPAGWRVPDEDDWKALETLAGIPQAELNRMNLWGGTAQKAGGKLKSKNPEMWASPNVDATDELGFNWVAGSQRYAYGEFAEANTFNTSGLLWSADTIVGNKAIRRAINANRADIHRDGALKGVGACVRCVKDAPAVSSINDELKLKLRLMQNFPNPFNQTTQIQFSIPNTSQVRLAVLDMFGREIAVILNNAYAAGNYTVDFDAGNLTSGMYIYRLEANGSVSTRKMTLVK
jgi:uncharacterized protein (TIGR02145 family)